MTRRKLIESEFLRIQLLENRGLKILHVVASHPAPRAPQVAFGETAVQYGVQPRKRPGGEGTAFVIPVRCKLIGP